MVARTPEQTATIETLRAQTESLRKRVAAYGAPWQAPYELVQEWQTAQDAFRTYAKSIPPIYGTPLRTK